MKEGTSYTFMEAELIGAIRYSDHAALVLM